MAQIFTEQKEGIINTSKFSWQLFNRYARRYATQKLVEPGCRKINQFEQFGMQLIEVSILDRVLIRSPVTNGFPSKDSNTANKTL